MPLKIIIVRIFQISLRTNFSHSFLFSSEQIQSLPVSEQVPINFLLKNKYPKLSSKVKKSTIKIVRKNSILFKFNSLFIYNLSNRETK